MVTWITIAETERKKGTACGYMAVTYRYISLHTVCYIPLHTVTYLHHRAVGEDVDFVGERRAEVPERLVADIEDAVVVPHVIVVHRAAVPELAREPPLAQLCVD